MMPDFIKQENKDLFLDRDLTTSVYQMLMKARYNYNLFLKIVERFKEEYFELTKVSKDIRYNTISYKYIKGEVLILHEYFLMVNNNDVVRLKSILDTYGRNLAIKLADYEDIYSFPGDGIAKFISNSCIVSDEIKKLIEEKIGLHLKYWKQAKHSYRGSLAGQEGIANILTVIL